MDLIEKLAKEYEFIEFLLITWKTLWVILILLFLILVGYEFNRTRRCRQILEAEHGTRTASRNSEKGAREFVSLLQRRKIMIEDTYSRDSLPAEERYLKALLEDGSTESLARLIRECHARGCDISLRPSSGESEETEVSDNKLIVRRKIVDADNLSIYTYLKHRNIEDVTGHKR